MNLRSWWSHRQQARREREHARVIASIRESMAWFGHPIDHLTDEEIEAGVMRFSEAIQQSGITAAEATAGLSAAFRHEPDPAE